MLFSDEHSANLNCAEVAVVVPFSHEPGKIERPTRPPPDPNINLVVQNRLTLTSGGFRSAIEQELRNRPPAKRKVMIWVRSHNNRQFGAVLRRGQFVEDGGYDGIPILYSGTSVGRLSK